MDVLASFIAASLQQPGSEIRKAVWAVDANLQVASVADEKRTSGLGKHERSCNCEYENQVEIPDSKRRTARRIFSDDQDSPVCCHKVVDVEIDSTLSSRSGFTLENGSASHLHDSPSSHSTLRTDIIPSTSNPCPGTPESRGVLSKDKCSPPRREMISSASGIPNVRDQHRHSKREASSARLRALFGKRGLNFTPMVTGFDVPCCSSQVQGHSASYRWLQSP